MKDYPYWRMIKYYEQDGAGYEYGMKPAMAAQQ
jgi:hypothetical protein